VRLHPLRGAIFETWVVAEVYKSLVHRGRPPDLHHYRESRGPEIDLLIGRGDRLDAVEIKSGATVSPDFFRNLDRVPERLAAAGIGEGNRYLVYGGDSSQRRTGARVLAWREVGTIATDRRGLPQCARYLTP
jgi:predicted AAA+ superfamily ATPase